MGAPDSDILQFKILPGFADFLLKDQLRQFTKYQLDLMFKLDLPILKNYDLSAYTQDQLIELGMPAYADFLNAAINNKLNDFIEGAVKKWKSDQLPDISRDQLVVKDITLSTHIRKKAFLEFIPLYTNDIKKAIELTVEIEEYALHAMSSTFNSYLEIHNARLNGINERLERNEELYKQAQKLTHIGNWVWDVETGQIKYSDELLRIYGIKPNEEMTFDKAIKLVHPDDLEKMNEALNYSLTTHKPHEIVFRVIRPDGDERIIRRHAEVLLDEKGKPYKLAGTGQDITKEVLLNNEIKKRESQLAELNLSLEQKNIALERSNKELTSFSYVASHDLQEPLRKIKTFSNLILEKEKNLSEQGKDCFGRIIISAGRMQTLIEDLLSFSRTQVFENTLKPVDLNQVLSEIKILHSETINDKRLFFNIQPLPIIDGIAFQIQQLFENIVSNSIKYSKPGQKTEITVTCITCNAELLPINNSEKNKNYYKISISDNGIGFDQKYAEKIFEIFQRLHGKNEYSGTGIGLSICKKIVENHKGYIMAHSEIDKGSTFDIYLPQNLY